MVKVQIVVFKFIVLGSLERIINILYPSGNRSDFSSGALEAF